MNKALLNLLTQLNEAQLMYAIGGSMMLKLRSFDVIPKDLDIMVSEVDFQHVIEIFQSIATQVNKPSHSPFKTKMFTTFILDDMTIDIMAGFAYEHIEGIYYAMFDSLSITEWVVVKGHHLPLMALEEWYIMYMIMDRTKQVELIETYWKKNSIEHPHLLIRQQNQVLPKSINYKITKMLNKY